MPLSPVDNAEGGPESASELSVSLVDVAYAIVLPLGRGAPF